MRLARQWQDGDTIALRLPMKVLVHQWPANHDCVSVNYGPLTFSLKIGERYQQKDSTRTAMGDSGWQASADPAQWPSSGDHAHHPLELRVGGQPRPAQ